MRRDTTRVRWPALLLAIAIALAGCGSPPGAGSESAKSDPSAPPPLPSKPVTLTVLDVSGDLVSTKALMQDFQKANPKLVKDVKFLEAPSPDMVGKLKAQQNAGRVDIDLVLTGNDGVAAGLSQNMWVKMFPALGKALPDPSTTLTPVGKTMQGLADDHALVNRASANGPLLQYEASRLPDVPKTPGALLQWAKAHPGKFIYARPSNSGPGRTFMMALPYLLGDRDPTDPAHGWTKTWAYLKELGKYVNYYPSGTADTLKMLGNGRVDLIPSTTGFDVQGRSDGTLPKDSQIALFDRQKWVADAHYMAIPRGGDKDRLAVTLAMMKWIMRPEQQAKTIATGNLTPAVKGADLSTAPAASKRFAQKWGRPDEYPRLLKSAQIVAPVGPQALVGAFDRWDREIGSKH